MKLEETQRGLYVATMTAHELSVLLAGARMSLSLMEAEDQPSGERARAALAAVLSDLDTSLARLRAESDTGE